MAIMIKEAGDEQATVRQDHVALTRELPAQVIGRLAAGEAALSR
jgi:hypothetical protein